MSLRTSSLAVVVVLSNVVGNLFLTVGVRHPSFTAVALAQLTAGVLLLIVWTLSRLALLGEADLSYVLPITAVGYVLTAFVGHWLLGEQVTARRWWGTGLIFAGVAVVGVTRPKTPLTDGRGA